MKKICPDQRAGGKTSSSNPDDSGITSDKVSRSRQGAGRSKSADGKKRGGKFSRKNLNRAEKKPIEGWGKEQ